MTSKFFIIILLISFAFTDIKAQNEKWRLLNVSNSSIADNNITKVTTGKKDTIDFILLSSFGKGIQKYDGNTWTIINTANSLLPSDSINTIYKENDTTFWFCTYKGVAKLTGNNWSLLNYLEDEDVTCMVKDSNYVYWFGTKNNGIKSLEANQWTDFNTSNSNLPDNHITGIVADTYIDEHIFASTFSGGIVEYNYEEWVVYNKENSLLPSDTVYNIIINPSDESKWIATEKGLARLFLSDMTLFDTSDYKNLPAQKFTALCLDDSGILWVALYNNNLKKSYFVSFDNNQFNVLDEASYPDSLITSIFIEPDLFNIWISFKSQGLALYNENGVVMLNLKNLMREQNITLFPNPFSDFINIKFNKTKLTRITLTDINGRIIHREQFFADTKTIKTQNLPAGLYLLNIFVDNRNYTRKIIKK